MLETGGARATGFLASFGPMMNDHSVPAENDFSHLFTKERAGEDDANWYWGEPAKEQEPISHELLATMSWTEDDGGGIEGELICYRTICIHHDDLMTWFPARGPGQEEQAASSFRNGIFEAAGHHSAHQGRSLASIESKCRAWIAKLAAEGASPRSRDDLFKQALAEFPTGLSRRGFDRCWDQTAPDRWKRAGRRPRQN